jgi:hypothetical protein
VLSIPAAAAAAAAAQSQSHIAIFLPELEQ